MILSRIMPTYLQFLFEMMTLRNLIEMGWNFFINDANPICDDILERIVQIENTRV